MKTQNEIQKLYDYLVNTRNEMTLDNNAITSIMEIESQICMLAWVLDIKLSVASFDCSTSSTKKEEPR